MEIDFSSLDYSAMMVDPYNIPPKKDIREVYSDFYSAPEYWQDLHDVDIKKVLRYVAFVYDKSCPLKKVITDFKKLKLQAAVLAGFIKQEDGRFLSNVEAVITCSNKETNKIILRYCLQHKNATYIKYIMYQQLYFTQMESLLSGDRSAKLNDFDSLADALIPILKKRQEQRRESATALSWSVVPQHATSMRDAYFADTEYVSAQKAIGRVSADLIAPYPPGVAVVAPGEVLTETIISGLSATQKAGVRIAYASDPTLATYRVIK